MPSLLILHPDYPPETGAGALRVAQLAEGMVGRGFAVTVWASRRSFSDPTARYPWEGELNGVRLWRVDRPAFPIHRSWGRAAARVWTIIEWAWRILFQRAPDVVLVTSDPPFAHLIAPWLRLRWGKSRLVHWCRAVRPELDAGAGGARRRLRILGILRPLSALAYRAFDAVVVGGDGMRAFFETPAPATPAPVPEPPAPVADQAEEGREAPEPPPAPRPLEPDPDPYGEKRIVDGILRLKAGLARRRGRAGTYAVREAVCVADWALTEPPGPLPIHEAERAALCGVQSSASGPRLVMMLSGTLPRHQPVGRTLELVRSVHDQAEALRKAKEELNRPPEAGMGGFGTMGVGQVFAATRPPVAMVFSVSGPRVGDLRAMVAPGDPLFRIVPPAAPEGLRARLAAADIQVVTLDGACAGSAIPSKFFGALAVGRPVVFDGSPASDIARWIREHRVGWVLEEGKVAVVAADLLAYSDDEKRRDDLIRHCHYVYQRFFAKKFALPRWEAVLGRAEGD